jgi:hypothetical protein
MTEFPALTQEVGGEWKSIVGYTNYAVSDRGLVYSFNTKRLLKQQFRDLGYPRLHLSNNGVSTAFYVARLVGKAFVPGETEEKCEIDHINRDPYISDATNLRWVTREDQARNRKAYSQLGYPIGVSEKGTGFSAAIFFKNRRKSLGTCDTPEDAGLVYAEAAVRIHGDHVLQEVKDYWEANKHKFPFVKLRKRLVSAYGNNVYVSPGGRFIVYVCHKYVGTYDSNATAIQMRDEYIVSHPEIAEKIKKRKRED